MNFLLFYYCYIMENKAPTASNRKQQPRTSRLIVTHHIMVLFCPHFDVVTDKNREKRRKQERGRTGSTVSPIFRACDSRHISVGRRAADLSQPGQLGHVNFAALIP